MTAAMQSGPVSRQGEAFQIDGSVLARAFNMPIAHFMIEMRRGNVHGIVERGTDEDDGQHRLSFRYRGRELRMTVDRDGNVSEQDVRTSTYPATKDVLRSRLRQVLVEQALAHSPITYARLAERIGFRSGRAIKTIDSALEEMMEDDVQGNRPFLAAIALESIVPGIPPEWFFRKARSAGRFDGEPKGNEAYAFHAKQLQGAIHFYGDETSVS